MGRMTTFGFIGAGNMASAIVRGAVGAGTDPAELVVTDAHPEAAARLAADLGVGTAASNVELVERCDHVVLAVKPQVLGAVLAEVREALARWRPVVVSIAAGQTLERLERGLPPGLSVIRVMPNVNAMISAGMAAVCGNDRATPGQPATVVSLFSAVGQAIELPEKDFPVFTALAASGPAFVFTFIDALARGGVQGGLPKPLAVRIAAQTVLGSAQLVLARAGEGVTPADLTDMVASPAGTTIAGLVAGEEAGFSPAVVRAVAATVARDRELGTLA